MLLQYDHSINKYRQRFFEEKFSNLHLKTPDVVLMVKISEAKTIKMAQIINEFPFHKSHVTRAVDRLFELNYLKKTLDPDDLRGYILEITPNGEKIATEVKKGLDEWNELLNKPLSQEELDSVARIREKIYNHLKTYFEEEVADEKNI